MKQAHILVVDDVKTSTTVMDIALTRAKFRVTVKNSPIQALSWLRLTDDPPDLIITDLNMPEMSGATFVRRLKQIPKTARTPVIMLTAHSRQDLVVDSLEAGVDDYLIKPISNYDLIARVTTMLQAHQIAESAPPPEEDEFIN
jgi:DNA-binding response OmpR family regulator